MTVLRRISKGFGGSIIAESEISSGLMAPTQRQRIDEITTVDR